MRKLVKIAVAVFIALVVVLIALWYLPTIAGKRFLRPVKMGMSQHQVQSLLGSPTYISKTPSGNVVAEVWDYHRWWMGDVMVEYDTNLLVSWTYIEW